MTFSERSAAGADLELWGDVALADPLFLLAVPIGLACVWAGTRPSLRVAPGANAPLGLKPSLRQRLGFLPALLQAACIVALGIALARPVRTDVLRSETGEGVDILLVVDRSGSMAIPDMDGEQTRMDVVKDVVADFAQRRMTDREGAADAVGLMTFALYPELVAPFTLDDRALLSFLEGVDVVRREAEDGTAIGTALAKGASLIGESKAKSRVIVLLTDGENNVNDIAPLEAAEFAASAGVRVYTILAGRYQYTFDRFGRRVAREVELDPTELKAIAEQTGGRFYRARDREELEGVYEEIEELERTEREVVRTLLTYDLYPHWLLGGLLSYLLAQLLSATWLRRTLP
jgi:Ca-activated chloride channel family protein